MAGTLVISTLSDGTSSASATDAIKGSARAWVNFNGVTTATIRASYNVSSVVRNAVGDYTINFTNALADANYAVSVGGSSYSSTQGIPATVAVKNGGVALTGASATKTTTALGVVGTYGNNGGGFVDLNELHVTIFR